MAGTGPEPAELLPTWGGEGIGAYPCETLWGLSLTLGRYTWSPREYNI
jgi:hypothetical protein